MWKKIKVLLWKSLQIRKKHLLSTFIEIMLPCLIFLFLNEAGLFILSETKSADKVTVDAINRSPVSKEELYRRFVYTNKTNFFIYTPKTSETKTIINTLINILNINPNSIETSYNESEMIKKFKIKSYNISNSFKNFNGFGIVFEEITKSHAFKYKIRCTNFEWISNELFENTDQLKKRFYYSQEYFKGFIALQLALDEAFIKLSISDKNIFKIPNYDLKIQSFPYLKHQEYSLKNILRLNYSLLTILSFLQICSCTIKKVVEEKESGVKELMKVMGLKSWMIWTGWVLHILLTFIISITFITYIMCFGEGQLLNYTNPFLFWIFLMVYMIAGIFFSFAIGTLFNRPLPALITGNILWCFSYILPTMFLKSITNTTLQTLFMILPNIALSNAYNTILLLESQNKGLQFSTLFTSRNDYNSFSVGFVLFIFIIDCFLYGFIAWYIDSVMPGKYGTAKPFNFLIQHYKNKTNNNEILYRKSDNKLFENPPTGYEVGISITNLYKCFGNYYAVNGVNLDLYKGQITTLLGHNGAGKTTMMSIITGLFSPSFGSVKINGNDLFSNIDHFRNNLGLCLQHNLLFSYLTTLDHLIFFGMLKGMSCQKAQSEGLHLLKILNMLQKKDEDVVKLSGGMKRKLSLAIALLGDPEILILDEPTSGMDPESRREIWDLLLSFRESRTILITTHFMEEADVLGDRIAIMDHGQVKCHGTSIFLKNAYGTGYKLTIVKEELCNESNLISAIKNIIPEAEIQSSLTTQVVINLPNEHTDKFPDVFQMLETNRKEFYIKGMGISCTTMEEVFLRSNTTKEVEDEPAQVFNVDDVQTLIPPYTSRKKLIKNQFKILLKKKITYTRRRPSMTLFFFILPILMIIYLMTSNNLLFNISNSGQIINVSLSSYKDISVYYRAGDNSPENLEPTFVAISKARLANVNKILSENNIINDLLKMYTKDEFKYTTNFLIAGDFNETKSSILYNDVAIHAPAIAVNLYSNALLQKLSGNTKSYISTLNEPIQFRSENGYYSNVVMQIIFNWLCIFSPALLYLVGYFIALPSNERVTGMKHLQMMTKLSPIVYWTACFIWDYFCYIIVVMATLVIIYLFDEYHIFTGFNEICVFLTLLLIYGWSAIFYAYVYSFFKKTFVDSMTLFITINYIIGLIFNSTAFMIKNVIMELNTINPYNILNILRSTFLMVPYFSFSSCIMGFLQISLENHKHRKCESLDVARVCSGGTDSKLKSYFVFKSEKNQFGILEETLFLLFSSILYITIILLFDYKIFARIHQYGFNAIVSTGTGYKEDNEDPDVSDERDKVNAAKTRSYDTLSPLLLVDDLVKKFSFKFTGVRSISFTVSPGECFGLLGVNGAGKTTVFRILTGDTFPSKGDAFIQSNKLYKLSSNMNQYVSMIGYCPQFDALIDQLTGEESLKLMAILRGISPLNAKGHVDKWIKLLGLHEYKDRVCGKFSGGNKRKLNTAMALIGDPPVVFLDEPTSGLDPIARRNLCKILRNVQRRGQAIVFTSHSMAECETLCNRLTIMVNGVMKCIGSTQYLKNRYGQGFTVMIKLRYTKNTNISKLKADIESQFTPSINLKDEHKGLLHYHITNPYISLFKIFAKLKVIMENYSIVEDFIIGDTTLEQVFIAFARLQAVINTIP